MKQLKQIFSNKQKKKRNPCYLQKEQLNIHINKDTPVPG